MRFSQCTVRRRRRPWRLFIQILLLMSLAAGLLISASLVLRSQWFLRSRIDPKLAELSARLHGDFSYGSISPAGLTGVVLEDLRFTPEGDDGEAPFVVERLVVYPDLAEMIMGHLEARVLEIHGVQVNFALDGGRDGRGHWTWLEAVVDDWKAREAPVQAGPGTPAQASSFPEIRILSGRFSFDSPGGSMPHMGMWVDELCLVKRGDELDLQGAVHVDGLGYAMLSGDANRQAKTGGLSVQLAERTDLLSIAPQKEVLREVVGENSRLEFSGITLEWPPALVVHGLRLTDTHIGIPGQDGAYIQELGADRVRIGVQDQQAAMRIDRFQASLRVQWLDQFGANIPLWLPQIDVLADFEAHRVGVGFKVGDAQRGHLSLAAALDLRSSDLALQIDAERYDAGPLLSFVPYMGPVHATRGILDGWLSVRVPLREELVQVHADIGIEQMDILVPWIAKEPLTELNMGLAVAALVDVREGRLSIEPSTLRIGELPFLLEGQVARTGEGRHVLIDAKVTGSELDAQALLASLPKGFAPSLEGYQVEGKFGLAFDVSLDTRKPEQMELEHSLDVSTLHVLTHGPVADVPLLASTDFAIRVKAAKTDTVIGPSSNNWTPYFRVPRHLPQTLIAAEDGRFYSHDGFDEAAITSSLVQNLRAGEIVRGGSTISQQVVKNLFLSGEKTLSRKFQEAFLTWQLEEHVSKERIMELYMNLAHWGPGIYGIKDAAEHYFGKRASRLTVLEALFLAAILPNPELFGRQYAEGFIRSDRLTKMRNALFVLYRKGIVGEQSYASYLHAINRANISSSPRPQPPAATPAPSAAEPKSAPQDSNTLAMRTPD
jgi:monofunctional biosynthetic peptidoglycan transglycosylase